MFNYTNSHLREIVVHNVGNKTNGRPLFLSRVSSFVSEDTRPDILTFLVSGFRDVKQYRLTHATDVSLNTMYNYSCRIFNEPEKFVELSQNIAKHLYGITEHPLIKDGDLIIGIVDGIFINDKVSSAIAIIKSESKDKFFKTIYEVNGINLSVEDGISSGKIDKGCLIVNGGTDEDPYVYIIDKINSNDEAKFWTRDFLGAEELNNYYDSTKAFMDLCNDFIKEQMPHDFQVDKVDQIKLLSKSSAFFKDNENLNVKQFEKKVLSSPELIKAFESFKNVKQPTLMDDFQISQRAVRAAERRFKPIIKLDDNFDVYIYKENDLIERGYDAAKDLHYYKIYFKQEK